MVTENPQKVAVRNLNHPGRVKQVDAKKYRAMKRAFLKALPRKAPGLTLAEIRKRIRPLLSEELFPHGAKAGWWEKTVQLDLEAKGLVKREPTRPLRLRKI